MRRMFLMPLSAALVTAAIFAIGCCPQQSYSTPECPEKECAAQEPCDDDNSQKELNDDVLIKADTWKMLNEAIPVHEALPAIMSRSQIKTDTSIPLFSVEGLWAEGYVFPRDIFESREDADEDVSLQPLVYVHILPDDANMPKALDCDTDGHKDGYKMEAVQKFSLIVKNISYEDSEVTNGSRLAVFCPIENEGDHPTLRICSDNSCGFPVVLDINIRANGFGFDCDGEYTPPSYTSCPTWGLVSAKNPDEIKALKEELAAEAESASDAGL